MTTATAPTLGDLDRKTIARIEWRSLRRRVYILSSRQQIDYWLASFGSVTVERTALGWRSVQSSVPYEYFEVFLQP